VNRVISFLSFFPTQKRLNNRRRSNSDEDGEGEALESALIYGYLMKLGRNGKWQARWFETDGECLTYYKCSKRVKLLATLDLAKVGSIVMNTEDRSGTSFTINISERPYHLRADSVAACKDWVITLNRVKEARMLEGNVKLAKPTQRPLDLLDDYAPKVVVVANRQRTRAIDDDDMQSWESGAPWKNAATEEKKVAPSSAAGRLARWQKPRNSLSRLAAKLANWARSIRNHGCVDSENQVVLDRHLHPPGHDDAPSPSGSTPPAVPAIMSLEKSAVAKAPMGVGRDDEDDGVRHLS
jgi:PH domain